MYECMYACMHTFVRDLLLIGAVAIGQTATAKHPGSLDIAAQGDIYMLYLYWFDRHPSAYWERRPFFMAALSLQSRVSRCQNFYISLPYMGVHVLFTQNLLFALLLLIESISVEDLELQNPSSSSSDPSRQMVSKSFPGSLLSSICLEAPVWQWSADSLPPHIFIRRRRRRLESIRDPKGVDSDWPNAKPVFAKRPGLQLWWMPSWPILTKPSYPHARHAVFGPCKGSWL